MSAPSPVEGAGLISSVYDFGQALTPEGGSPDLGAVAFSGAGLVLDVAAFAGDPFGELSSAGFGWLIEHVPFLRDLLDAVAGDPGEITAGAQSWRSTAVLFEREAARLRSAPVAGWSGEAAERYRAAELDLAADLRAAAEDCAWIAEEIVRSGVWVGTTRALIRDTIADLLVKLIEWALLALFTAGVGTAVVIAGVVVKGLELAARITGWLTTLLRSLAEAAGGLGQVAGRLADAAGGSVRRFEEAARETAVTAGAHRSAVAEVLTPAVRNGVPLDVERSKLGADAVVEYGKQDAAARAPT